MTFNYTFFLFIAIFLAAAYWVFLAGFLIGLFFAHRIDNKKPKDKDNPAPPRAPGGIDTRRILQDRIEELERMNYQITIAPWYKGIYTKATL